MTVPAKPESRCTCEMVRCPHCLSLDAEIQRLKEQARSDYAHIHELTQQVATIEPEIQRLTRALKVAVEAMEKYGQHDTRCAISYWGGGDCVCGLLVIIQSLKGKTEGEKR